jgi:hypothetical protein
MNLNGEVSMSSKEFLEKLVSMKQAIYETRGDPEVAHGREDSMMEFYIDHSLEFDRDTLAQAVKIILEVRAMEFSRWGA